MLNSKSHLLMNLKHYLANDGLVNIPRSHKHDSLSLKKIIQILNSNQIDVSRLTPRNKIEARPNSLSSRFGLGAFPPHTDYAFRDIPPRYIIMHAPRPRAAKTLIFDSRHLLQLKSHSELGRCLFQVLSSKNFYSKLLTNHRDEFFLRYNSAIMLPINKEASAISEFILYKWRPTTIIDWTETRTIIIDNWLMLHSRSEYSISNSIKSLWRIALWSK
jgi:hypothetical protein